MFQSFSGSCRWVSHETRLGHQRISHLEWFPFSQRSHSSAYTISSQCSSGSRWKDHAATRWNVIEFIWTWRGVLRIKIQVKNSWCHKINFLKYVAPDAFRCLSPSQLGMMNYLHQGYWTIFWMSSSNTDWCMKNRGILKPEIAQRVGCRLPWSWPCCPYRVYHRS